MPITIPHGIPKPFSVRVQAGSSGIDLSAVTTVTLRVSFRGKAVGDWTTVLSEQSQSELVATHLLTTESCPGRGQYDVLPLLTVNGQSWPETADTFHLMIQ